MKKEEMRSIAIGAVRSELRRLDRDPTSVNGNNALAVLDDLARAEPKLLASKWYIGATPTEYGKFKREWIRDTLSPSL